MVKKKQVKHAESRKAPKQARSRRTYDLILEGASSVIIEKGIAKLTTNGVAEKSGVSIGSLYQYFPSKDALVAALIDRAFNEEVTAAKELFSILPEGTKPKYAAIKFFNHYYRLRESDFEFRKVLIDATPIVHRAEKAVNFHGEMASIAIQYFTKNYECKNSDQKSSLFMLQYLLKGIILSSIDGQISSMSREKLSEKWADILLELLEIRDPGQVADHST